MAKSIKLGAMQTQIMNVLWDKGKATAKEITDELSKASPVAHSTVQTLLRLLEKKKAVKHEADGRTFVFRPAVERTKGISSPLDIVLERFYGGSLAGLVSHLLEDERISDEELIEIKRLIDEHVEKEKEQ